MILIGAAVGVLVTLAAAFVVHVVGTIVTKQQLIKRGEGYP
jgi:hypothetical protein